MIGQLLASEKKIEFISAQKFFSKKEILLLGPGSNLKKILNKLKNLYHQRSYWLLQHRPQLMRTK